MVNTSAGVMGAGSGSVEACEEERGLQRGSELGCAATRSTARRLWSCGAVRNSPLGSHIAAEDADTLILGGSDVSSTPAKARGREEALLMMPGLPNLAVSVRLMLTLRVCLGHGDLRVLTRVLTTACAAS